MDLNPYDEREGLPSASSFNRYDTCAGSLALEYLLKQEGRFPKDHGTRDSEKGTTIHTALELLAKGDENALEGLTLDERDTAEQLWERAQVWITKLFGTNLSDVEVIVEERYWLYSSGGQKMTSGRYDLILKNEDRGLLADYKTLFGEHPPAPDNWQMRLGGVLLRENLGILDVTTVLLQNMKRDSHFTMRERELEESLERVDEILARQGKDPFQLGFTVSHHCDNCPVRFECPKMKWDVATVERRAEEMLVSISDEGLGAFLNACRSMERVQAKAQAEAEFRIKSLGANIPDWKLEAAAPRREIKDAPGMRAVLIANGAKAADIDAIMKFSVSDVERIMKSSTGKKGKDFAGYFESVTEGIVGKNDPQPSLKPV